MSPLDSLSSQDVQSILLPLQVLTTTVLLSTLSVSAFPLLPSQHGVKLRSSLLHFSKLVETENIPPVNGENLDFSKFEGQPSTPGWKNRQFNELTNWIVADKANRPIISEYDPNGLWLWTRWEDTVLSLTYIPIALSMTLCTILDVAVHHFSTSPSWPLLSVPPQNDVLVQQLLGINNLWEYLLTLCTFILTFFISQSYSHWRNVYTTTRSIQGRINDVCILLTIGAENGPCNEWGCGEDSGSEDLMSGATTGYSPAAADLVVRCTRLIRLSHTFFWAATPTVSNGLRDKMITDAWAATPKEKLRDADIGPILLSPEGLKMLVSVGELTDRERKALLESGLPPSQYASALLQWVGSYSISGLRDGRLWKGEGGMEENLLRQITALRAVYFDIGDLTSGRMPLAYVQLVQVLVDSLVLMSPFALYPTVGGLAIPLTGLLTLFFKGLLRLSKSFLDPFGNEGFTSQNIRVDVLVSELNFGAKSRWVKAGAALPKEESTMS